MDSLNTKKVTMRMLAYEELKAFMDSGLNMCALSIFDYDWQYAGLMYRSAAKRFCDSNRRDLIKITCKDRKIYAEKRTYDD